MTQLFLEITKIAMTFGFVGNTLILLGIFFTISGTIGMLRFQGFFPKIHCASLTDSFGVPLILLGCAAHQGLTFYAAKLILLIPIMMLTSSTSTYLLCKMRSKGVNKR